MATDPARAPARDTRRIAQAATEPAPWAGLCETPERILDADAVRADLTAAVAAAPDRAALRPAAVAVLRAAHADGRGRIAEAVAAAPTEAHRAIHDYAWLADRIVTLTLDFALAWLHPLANPTSTERIAVVAVGGYGRGEMAPFSDIDLLFLTPYKQTAWGESLIESVLYCLWDLRLKVGHAARTVDDTLRMARQDLTIRTALLENRYVWGDRTLSDTLTDRLWSELFTGTGPEFVVAKLAERDDRHARQGGSRYLLEPNVKDGKGGLRDLQTLYWIAKYLHRGATPESLVELGAFSAEEQRVFADAEAFLWLTRVHLHLLNQRATEQLTFDAQVEIAARLGYAPTEGQRSVERFMQRYFTHAKHVGDLTRIFLAGLEARHVKPRPSFGQALRNVFAAGREAAAPGPEYRMKHGRLDVADQGRFLADPVNILRLFERGLEADIPIHPDALRLVAANLALIDDRLRGDREANRIFLSILAGNNHPERAIRLMNEVGVLGAFVPTFGRVVAMMQFNMYHHYTVDEHTIQAIATLSQILRGELKVELPVASGIVERGVNRRALYVALLIHDLGKGSGRDHSTVGAEIARSLCPRLGLNPEESTLVEWLVKNHLMMSDVAQRRDLADPRTVGDFAAAVQSPSRLRLLTVLTVCDIRGVGPGVWNNWKAMLLRALYAETLERLTGGAQPTGTDREAAAKEALAAGLAGWTPDAVADETARHYGPYWLGFDTRTHAIFARLIQRLAEGEEPAMHAELEESRDATQVCFVLSDHPGIFARLAGALALAGANVVDARTYTSSDGVATAAFWIQDRNGNPYEKSRLSRLRNSVLRTLKGEIVARDALRDKDRVKKRERDFDVPTRVTFDNLGSDIYTIIEVEALDRPGLLYDVARTLTGANVSIASAIIATYGKQAVDVFYVKDLFGLKLYSATKRRAVELRLRAAIEPPATPSPAQAAADALESD